MKRLLFGCWLALVIVADVRACLWDRDTVEHESKGVPDAMDVIAGRFERNPPLYFQMRKERVLALLKREPANLAAYDDAAVACDRLGDDDGAITLMEEKARQLAVTNAPEKSEQLYRYEANLGTFYVHRWLRRGADRKNMGDVDLASRHIGEALRINPDAHFGREKYQLLLIDWIRNPPIPDKNPRCFPTFLTHTLSAEDGWSVMSGFGGEALKKAGFGNANEGLSGLVSLGNAWESVDVFYALDVALNDDRRSTIAYLGLLRIKEIIDHRGRSLLPNAPSGKELKQKITSFLDYRIDTGRRVALRVLYLSLRSSAEKWQAHRIAYMEGRLKKGSHPDTDADFWSGYKETPRPALSTRLLGSMSVVMVAEYVIFTSLPILFLIFFLWWRRRKSVTRLAVY